MGSTGHIESRGFQPNPNDGFGFGIPKRTPDKRDLFCQSSYFFTNMLFYIILVSLLSIDVGNAKVDGVLT